MTATKGYNEIIVGERAAYERVLPLVIEAFVLLEWEFTTAGYMRTGAQALADAERVHARFLRAYSLSRQQVPLLRYSYNPYLRPTVATPAFEGVRAADRCS